MSGDDQMLMECAIELNNMIRELFTEEEIQDFKDCSLGFPWIIYEKHPDNVVEVYEVTSLSGMAKNKGVPTEITIFRHKIGQDEQKLIYKLVEN